MSDDAPLKSAYELAMERLRAGDGEQRKPLSARQKKRIAEIRSKAQARLAEIEILHRKNVAGAQGDPEALRKIEEHMQIDRRRVEESRDAEIAQVRKASD